MKAGSVKEENEEYVDLNLEMGRKRNVPVLMPFWCRHHWLLLRIMDRDVKVFDSAPSKLVKEDVERWCGKKGLRTVKMMKCPQQRRFSRECGVFVIGFMFALITDQAMGSGVVSLQETREQLEKREPPTTQMFAPLFNHTPLSGSGTKDKWSTVHQMYERWAAGKNLCFMLCAALMMNRARESEGKRGVSINQSSLIGLAKECKIELDGDNRAQQSDVESAIMALKELKYFKTKIITIDDIKTMEVGEEAIVIKNFNEVTIPTYCEVKAAIRHEAVGWEVYRDSLQKLSRSARGGHYKYGGVVGSTILIKRKSGDDRSWKAEHQQEIVHKATEKIMKESPKTCVVVHAKPNDEQPRKFAPTQDYANTTGTAPAPKAIRHARITAIMRISKRIRAQWVLDGVGAELIGDVVRNDDDEEKMTVRWTHKRCGCEDWRALTETLEDICPIPKAQYLACEPMAELQGCQCAGDDDEEDFTAPAHNDNVEEGWREQEAIEPLGPYTLRAPLHMITGGVGRLWKIMREKPKKVHRVVWQALAEATRKKHIEWLFHIQQMPVDLHEEHLDRAVVELIMRMAKERKWAWSTISCIFSTVHTALKNLNIYTNETTTYDLKESTYFTAAMKRAQKLARNAGPNSQLSTPMKESVMLGLIKDIQDVGVRTLLAMSWAFAARVGDMRQVEAKHVLLPPNNNNNIPTSVTFKKGKGGAFWGAYTIHTILPLDTWKDMAEMTLRRRNEQSIWTTSDQRKLSAIVNKLGINLRSIRRGALLHNAHRGVSDSDLQYLSGHKRIDTLMRYLGWGVESSSSKEAARNRHKLAGGEANCEIPVEPKKMGAHAGYQGTKGKRIEKPPSIFHVRPPTSTQLGLKKNARQLEIHVKNVGTANIAEIEEMAKKSKLFGKDCMFALQHLKGKKFCDYNEIRMPPVEEVPRAGFSTKQIKKLIDYGKLEAADDRGKAYVKGFPIVDGHKNRARALAEPFVNKYATPGKDYPNMKYPSRLENYEKWRDAKYAVQFDYAAYFDQFELDAEAREFMLMKTRKVKNNDKWLLTRLPMGAKFSPSIAQFTTWVICEPLSNIPDVTVSTMIDNVRITAKDKKGFVQAVRLFLARSDKAGLTLNEEALPYRTGCDEELARLGRKNVDKEFEFLGVTYNKNKIKNTNRLIEKLTQTNDLISQENIKRRQLAHIIGLAIFMAHTIGVSMANHFDLMREYNKLFEGAPEWDSMIQIPTTLRNTAKELIKILVKNEEREIPILTRPSENLREYDAIIIFDACKDAWAAKIHDVKKNETIRIMKRFKHQAKHSAHAEPMGATEVLKWAKENRNYKRVALITDHNALAMGQIRWWTGFGGHSSAYHINEAFKQINGYAEVFHIEGKNNITDADSRSEQARNAKEALVLPCYESWDMHLPAKHPYAGERKNFYFF